MDKIKCIKFLNTTFLLLFIAFGTIGGCGGGGGGDGNGNGNGNGELAGETNCTDGQDNDGDIEVDCDDIDCILDPACGVTCEDLLDAQCNRFEECEVSTFEDCLSVFEFLGFVCDRIEGTVTQECIDDTNELNCDAVSNGEVPESCEGVFEFIGICEQCEVDEDCVEGLLCFDCIDDCTGGVKRCSDELFPFICEDGIFKSVQR